LPQEDFFMKLKELITSAPVLVLPDDDLLFDLKPMGLESLPALYSPSNLTKIMSRTQSHFYQKPSIR
jgi:hypothetical protein